MIGIYGYSFRHKDWQFEKMLSIVYVKSKP